MYHHANLNFFTVLLQKPTWLMLFCVILCSASKLEHFKNEFIPEFAQSFFSGVMRSEEFYGIDLNQATADCSERCYSSKYFCDFFVVEDCSSMKHNCHLYNSKASNFLTSQLPKGHTTKAAYWLSEPDHIEPLEKRFSFTHKKSLDSWVANLETEYSVSEPWGIFKNLLIGCMKAMNSKPATAIDFDKWVSRKDVSQFRRMPSELGTFTGRKILEAVKAWEQFTNGNKQEPTDYFDTLVLTFLDILCPLLQPHVTTIYDPIKKIVFITKEDLHILVVSYGPGDIALVQSKDNSQLPDGDPLVYVSNPHRQESRTQGNPVELFQQATSKTFSKPLYNTLSGSSAENPVNALLSVLDGVLFSLWFKAPWRISDNTLTGPWFILYRDLITVVLSNVYKKDEGRSIFTNLNTMQTRNVFGDISISTSRK